MDRSLQSVLIGTFTLRFSTGLTGAMLATYLAHFKEFHPEVGEVSAILVGVFAASSPTVMPATFPISGWNVWKSAR